MRLVPITLSILPPMGDVSPVQNWSILSNPLMFSFSRIRHIIIIISISILFSFSLIFLSLSLFSVSSRVAYFCIF